MGIRFFCPNGHRLHVKAFLAGKRGYCPKCGTKLLIPESSAAALQRPNSADNDQAADLLPRAGASEPGTAAAAAAAVEPQHPSEQTPDDPASQGPELERMWSANSGIEAVSQIDPQPDDALWYVRPPSGGQYGPATRGEIDRWNGEGRIPGESLVWREGWAEWRTAAESLHGRPVERLESPPAGSDEMRAHPSDRLSSTRLQSYQTAARRKKTAFVICLSLACLILTVIFLIVVRPGSG